MNDHIQNVRPQEIMAHIKDHETQYINFIRDRLGIIIQDHQKNDLHKLILQACKHFDCTEQAYLQKLKESPDHSPTIEYLINGITIGETYFFRDANQMHLLQDILLPGLIKKKREQGEYSIRIWSAGCASGEEIYTVAMLLCDMLPDIKNWTISLLATDINTFALKKALAGKFGEWSMRSISDHYKQRYFTTNKQMYDIAETIREMVTFMYLNLNDNTFPSILNSTNAQDLILCRNVLIYFDRDHGSRLMQKLSSSLVEGGSLILGASDPVYTTNTDLIFNFKQGALFTRPTLAERQKPLPAKPVLPEKIKLTPKLPPQPDKKTSSQVIPAIKEPNTLINQLLNEGRWQDILDTLQLHRQDLVKSAFFFNAEATALANIGKLNQAVECCQQSLTLDSTNIETHFTLAMILIELNRIEEAEVELRKTLFLDHQFVMGHFQLGLLLIKNRQQANGLKSLRNALSIVKANEPMQPVTGFQKLTYGQLAETLEHEIELYTTARGTDHVS